MSKKTKQLKTEENQVKNDLHWHFFWNEIEKQRDIPPTGNTEIDTGFD